MPPPTLLSIDSADTKGWLSSSAFYHAHMSSSPDSQAFLKSSELTLQSQDVLRQLLERFEHLDLTGKLSSKDPIIQKAHGGYGDVYVVHVWIRRKKIKCALKRLRFYIYKDKDFAKVRCLACSILRQCSEKERYRQLIAKEIRVWASLSHPNVLKLLGYILEENGFPSLISEWIGEGTVLEFVRNRPETNIVPLVRIVRSRLIRLHTKQAQVLGIARGMAYLHDQNVVHSDIKSVSTSLALSTMLLTSDRIMFWCPKKEFH